MEDWVVWGNDVIEGLEVIGVFLIVIVFVILIVVIFVILIVMDFVGWFVVVFGDVGVCFKVFV